MKKIKHLSTVYIIFLTLFIALAPVVHAVEPMEGSGLGIQLQNPLKVDNIVELLKALLNILIQIGFPLAAMAIIYSGFLMVTAKGNEEQLSKAKSAFGYTVLGSLILFGAWIIITAIENTIQLLQ